MVLAVTFLHAQAQQKLAMNDKALILSGETENLFVQRLQGDNLELTYSVDFKRKCEYWFAEISLENEDVVLTIKNCDDKIAGSKNLGKKIREVPDSDKAMLLYYAVSEILNEPYKNVPQPGVEASVQPSPLAPPARIVTPINPGQHRTRYFFAPSSFNLQEGELYYNSIYFFVHDVQYGISDQFSLGMGTTIIGFPFYLTPKITIPYSDNCRFAIGDIMMLGTWNSDFFGNLLYFTYTQGDEKNNVTLGGGYLYTSEGTRTGKSNAPVLNFSALGRMSDHIYFITENYISRLNTKHEVYNYSTYSTESYQQSLSFLYGSIGFRFINRERDVISWQIGLSYFYISRGDIPDKYKYGNWDVYDGGKGSDFVMFPVVGFTRKFGAKY
jgi:hypothetical protein